ncbi:MAG: Rho termination factor N-terminal domain-containing protein [Solirubrobacterales bacterium]
MTATLQDHHLADLHALAAELGIERYRMLGREELVAAILERDPAAASAASPSAVNETSAADSRKESGPSDGGDQPAAERPPQRRERSRGRGRNREGGRDRGRADAGSGDGEDEPDDPGEPVSGVLDITPRGHGFIRLSGLESDDGDVYVSPSQIRRCEMRRGDEVAGPARKPRRGERYPALVHVDTINGVEPGTEKLRLADATPVHPSRRIPLEPGTAASADEVVLLRSIDLLNPLAFGQRVLIKAEPGSGRTTLLRAMAASMAPRDDLELVVLLIDERPEEEAAWREAAPGADLAIATADLRPGEQLRLVELAFGRASRRAEAGVDVVLLVDSLSRIAVAADDPGRAKPIFGAGRETAEEDTGSLTVIATTLGEAEAEPDIESDMDADVDAAIAPGDDDDFEADRAADDRGGVERALETTESSLLVLDRELATSGVYPAIDAGASRVAGEEHLREEAELKAVRSLRAELSRLSTDEAAALLRERIEGSPDNSALLASLAG